MRLSSPAPGRRITSPYGPRRHPITGQLGKMHRGIDYGGRFEVLSAGHGVVAREGFDRGAGNWVVIDHGSVHTVYYHGAERTRLKRGDRVQAGDFIFYAGSTGASTGDHLHFEVRTGPGGVWLSDVDPTPYLNGNAAVSVLPVSGRADRATWRAWQTWLQKLDYYKGRIDGVPGPMTYRAIQAWAGVTQDGIIGPVTRKAVQRELGVKADGLWGRETWSTLQRKLNEGTL
jgi:murein DD-endopeptidase MepM/ murein hydrolase activator NlpD